LVGKTLGDYEIIEPLGSGGMGDVYRARDTNLRRDVAIKVLPEAMTADPERLARLQREAHLLASVNHPNIAAIYNLGESEGIRWLVLELVEGKTLEQRLRQGPLPVPECLRIAGQVAAALEAAHEKGIVHRDLKAANVMLDAKGRVKVLDFGIAKDLSGGGGALSTDTDLATQANQMAAQLTATGMIVGTVPYMSPEQIRGKGVDKRTDIWAFGCLLFELLTGRRPFDRETMADTLAAVLEHEPDWRHLPRDTPEALRALIERCLQKDPDSRLHMMADARLEVGVIEATGSAGRVARRSPGATPGSWLSPKPMAAAALGVLLIAVLAVGWGAWTSSDSAAPASAGPADNAIAVLEFVGVGLAPDDTLPQELAFAVHAALSRVGGLSLRPYNSSFAPELQALSAAEIGDRLKVATTLVASVRRDGDSAIVVLQMADTASDSVYWTETYKLTDLEAVDRQETIAGQMVDDLEVALLDDGFQHAGVLTESRQAWQAYKDAELAWPLLTEESLDEALTRYDAAIRSDQGFALAQAGMARTYLLQNRFGWLDAGPAEAGARRHIERALELNPELGAAVAANAALMRLTGDRGWSRELETAIDLGAQDPLAYSDLWWELIKSGGPTEQVVDVARRYQLLNPLDPGAWDALSTTDLTAGRIDDAIDNAKMAIVRSPTDSGIGQMALGVALQADGRADEAIEPLQRAVEFGPNLRAATLNLFLAYASLGRMEEVRERLNSVIIPARNGIPGNVYILLANLHRDIFGAPDDAAEWLEHKLELRPERRYIPPLVILALDRGDEAEAERLLESYEELGQTLALIQAGNARLSLDLFRSEYENSADLAASLAERDLVEYFDLRFQHGYYGSQQPIDPLGYMGLLAGRPKDSIRFYETNFPELLTDDPPVDSYRLKAAVDLAAVLMHTDEQEQAHLLLERAEVYIDGVSEEQRRNQFRTAPMDIYALQDRADEAFAAMDQAFEDGWRSGWWRLEHKPHFDSIRDDPRFDVMIERLRAATSG